MKNYDIIIIGGGISGIYTMYNLKKKISTFKRVIIRKR